MLGASTAFPGPRIDKETYETKVDKLLIEAKASGISAAQELRNRYEAHSTRKRRRVKRGRK